MATISAKTLLAQICLLLITAIVAVPSSDNSVLTELYKQAAKENRPLILVVDNHDKREQNVHHLSKQKSGSPFYYIQSPKTMSSQFSVRNKKNSKPVSKQRLLKQYLQRVRLAEQAKGKNNKESPSKITRSRNDRDDVRNNDDRYRSNEGRNKYDDRYRGGYDDRHRDRYDDRHRDKDDYRHRHRNDARHRDRYDDKRDRNDDRYHDRHDRDRENVRDRNRNHNRYRDDRHRDYNVRGRYRDNGYDDRDRYRDDDRDKENRYKYKKNQANNDYGTSVLTNLLRISNDLNCEALSECKHTCKYARVGSKSECEMACKDKYECEDEKLAGRENDRADSDCGENDNNSCGDEEEQGISTKGPTDDDKKNGGFDLEKCSGENSNTCI